MAEVEHQPVLSPGASSHYLHTNEGAPLRVGNAGIEQFLKTAERNPLLAERALRLPLL
jgi:hypothetical protein